MLFYWPLQQECFALEWIYLYISSDKRKAVTTITEPASTSLCMTLFCKLLTGENNMQKVFWVSPPPPLQCLPFLIGWIYFIHKTRVSKDPSRLCMGLVDLYSATVFWKITNTGEHKSWLLFSPLSLSALPFSVVPQLLMASCFSGGCNEIRLWIVFLHLLHPYRCCLQASLLPSCSWAELIYLTITDL